MEDEGVNYEGSVGEVDLRECVVEASEGVAQDGAGGFAGRRLSLDFILKMMAVVGLELGGIWFTEDGGDEGFN